MKSIIKQIAVMLDLTTNARLKVVTYLFQTLSINGNVLNITIRELSEALNVCTNTVTLTLKKLEQENIIKRRTGVIMLQTNILHQCQNTSGRDASDQDGININIQMSQDHYGGERQLKQKKQYKTRDEKREMAFASLTNRKNAEASTKQKSEINKREKIVGDREKACDLREASLVEKERTLLKWEQRLDALLGLEYAEL